MSLAKIANELRVDENGVGYCSVAGAARLAGVTQQSLFEAYRQNKGKLAVMLMQQGFNPTGFGSSGVPDAALTITLEYYAFHSSAKNAEALLNFRSVSTVGARVLIRQACGYNDQPKQLTREQQIAQALIWSQEEVEKLKTTVDELVEENVILTPKAKAFDRFLSTEGFMSVEEFAKTANVPGIGTIKMFELLREYGFIQQKPSVLPYQRHVATGLFVVKQVPARGSSYVNGSRFYQQTFITRKGVEHLVSKLGIN